MPYNPQMYMPVNYPVYQPPMPQMQQMQMQQNAMQQQQMQQQPQMMTPPTIHAEIVQVDGEQAAAQYPVGAGASQMMIARDDSAIFVKTATPNGQYTLDVFVKRPPAPVEPPFDPSAYVRRDEIDGLVASIVAAQNAPVKKASKKAEETE